MSIACRVLAAAGDDGLGCDFGVLLSLCFERNVLRIFRRHPLAVHQLQDVIAVRAGGVQTQHRYFVAVVILCDACVVSEQISLGIGAEPAHAGGTGVFNVRVEKICCFAYTGSTDHETVNTAVINEGGGRACPVLTPYRTARIATENEIKRTYTHVYSMSRRNGGVGRICLPCRGGTVLTVTDCLGFDSAEGIVFGIVASFLGFGQKKRATKVTLKSLIYIFDMIKFQNVLNIYCFALPLVYCQLTKRVLLSKGHCLL